MFTAAETLNLIENNEAPYYTPTVTRYKNLLTDFYERSITFVEGVDVKLTDSEWQIMTLLWERHPATAREIADRLPEDVNWAYTTIKTLLSRLVKKEAVREKKQGNVSVYEPIISQKKARRTALLSLVDKAFGGAVAPMIHFIAEESHLDQKRREKLLELLDELDQPEDE